MRYFQEIEEKNEVSGLETWSLHGSSGLLMGGKRDSPPTNQPSGRWPGGELGGMTDFIFLQFSFAKSVFTEG